MRTIVIVASCFCVILSVIFCLCVHAEPVAKERISFSLSLGDAFADKLRPGLNVVLIGKKICKAKTGATFTYEHKGVEPENFQATHLLMQGKCDQENANIAVIGVKAEAIAVISPQEGRSAVLKSIELEARRLLLKRDAAGPKQYSYAPLSRESPKTFTVKEGVLLHFSWKDEDSGPSVWIAKDRIFLLPGQCRAQPPIFFTIDDRLHLAYGSGGCCRCGDNTFYVYDLSGSKPKKLYENSNLGD